MFLNFINIKPMHTTYQHLGANATTQKQVKCPSSSQTHKIISLNYNAVDAIKKCLISNCLKGYCVCLLTEKHFNHRDLPHLCWTTTILDIYHVQPYHGKYLPNKKGKLKLGTQTHQPFSGSQTADLARQFPEPSKKNLLFN